MTKPLTRNNHYVPEWYQKGFLAPGNTQLHCLDTAPERRLLPNGRVVVNKDQYRREPGGNFRLLDLYTIQFGDYLNDEIERYLFGRIDDAGARAVKAFIEGDEVGMHNQFQTFFEYLDAQKLRTPKGLDWIKSRYPSLSQLELMLEMQSLRLMHTTMWTEGVREIVSAEKADVRFIVSDDPVTIYNPAHHPESDKCKYPSDPLLESVGSQTIFALNQDLCLILTHLEYAQEPHRANSSAARTNARFYGNSLVRTDAFIRKRYLNNHEVTAINLVLKSRCRRYLAAAKAEWLFPENQCVYKWDEIPQVLLPKDDLWKFGGEIYVGYKDGTTQYQDAFGRTSGAHEYLKKRRSSSAPKSNDSCGCGSGIKYKECCKDSPEGMRPSWDVFSIRERNLMFCRAVEDILSLNSGRTWEDVRREISDKQVEEIYKAFGSLWPEDTNLVDLLPRRNDRIVRGVFFGIPDPRTLASSITGWLAHFDQLIITHPFINPNHLRPEYSPTKSPNQHKEQTIKNLFMLMILEPYIHFGLVHLIPDPGDLNRHFATTFLEMARTRTKGWKPDLTDEGVFQELMIDDSKRTLMRLPEKELHRYLKRMDPEAGDELIARVVSSLKADLASDPMALIQPMEVGEAGAQVRIMKGYSLETAMFLARMTGSFIYTDSKAQWQQLHIFTSALDPSNAKEAWKPLMKEIGIIKFAVELNLQLSLEQRTSGMFGEMRSLFRRIHNSLHSNFEAPPIHLTEEMARAVEAMDKTCSKVPSKTRICRHMEISIPSNGFDRNDITRLLVKFGRQDLITPLHAALLLK